MNRREFMTGSSATVAMASMAPGTALAKESTGSSGSRLLDEAWASYWADFSRIREMVYRHPLYHHDEATRINGNHWLHQMLYVGHSLAVEPQQLYPFFYSTVFQYPLHNTFGLPSPDNTFGLALIDGRHKYRIWGKRNTCHSVTIVVYHGFFGDENPAMMSEHQLDDFKIGADGSYEIIASADKVAGNWIEIDGTSKNVAIMVRHTHLDWGREQKAEMHVERIDIDNDLPGMWLSEADLAHRIITAGRLMMHMANMHNLLPDVVLKGTGGKFNSFFDLSGPGVSKFGTFNRAHYGNAVFEFGPDEALILEAPDPGPDAYVWNVQVGDVWYQTADYAFHQTSLNPTQAHVDQDGVIRMVIAAQDPGVQNWLDTMGLRFGVVVYRVYGPTRAIQLPVIRRVKFDQLRAALPAGTPAFSAEQRKASLRYRREGAYKRFGF